MEKSIFDGFGDSKNYYGFTTKINDKLNPTFSDYDEIVKIMGQRGRILCIVYEDKSKNKMDTKLHVHGIIRFDRAPLFRTLFPKGVHSRFELLYDEEGWKRYISKNEDKDEDFIKTHYMF